MVGLGKQGDEKRLTKLKGKGGSCLPALPKAERIGISGLPAPLPKAIPPPLPKVYCFRDGARNMIPVAIALSRP